MTINETLIKRFMKLAGIKNTTQIKPSILQEQTFKVTPEQGYYHVAQGLGLTPGKETYKLLRNAVKEQSGDTIIHPDYEFALDPETGKINLKN
jgi:hypothetical protein